MTMIGTFVGIIVLIGTSRFNLFFAQIVFGLSASFFIAGAGNVLNDYYDRDIDRINHPERPIPAGNIAPENAKMFSYALFSLGLILSAFTLTWSAFGIALCAVILLFVYESNFKRKGFSGNVIISILAALVFLYGGACVSTSELLLAIFRIFIRSAHEYTAATNRFIPVFILALLAFLATLSREIVKDIEDIRGDMDRRTLPKKIGIRNAAAVSAVVLCIAVILSPLPYLAKIFNYVYIAIVAIADTLLIYAMSRMVKNAAYASKLIKIGMAIALIGFVAGAVST